MKRKAIAMAMAMMMIASAASVCSAASVTDFKDVPSTSWYYASVKGAVDDGYMNGVTKDTFAPSNNLTRAMFATILARYDKATVDNTAKSAFTDVLSDQWYTGSVVWGSKNGIINGYSATKFGTNDFIKREDLALMVYRYVNFKKYTLKEKTPVTFKDADQISAYAKEALEYCRVHGLFIGDQNGYLHPQKLVTRAEAAAVMERIDLVIKESTGGGSSSGGGGGQTYTYSDYGVTVYLGKDNRSVDLPSYDDARQNSIYHVRYDSSGKYTENGSDKIDLVTVAKGVCDSSNIGRVFNATGIKGMTFTDSIGKIQTIVDGNGRIYDIPLKYVPVEEVLPSDTIENIASTVTSSMGLSGENIIKPAEVTNLLNKLDDDGITSKDDLSMREQEIAKEAANKLNTYTGGDGALVDRVIEKNPSVETAMKQAGITKQELIDAVAKYRNKLNDILGVNYISTADDHVALYDADQTPENTKGGIAVMVNPVTVAQTQYNKGLNKFVERYFPVNSLATAEEFKNSESVKALYDMMKPTDWVSGNKESGYTMLSEGEYQTKCEAVIDQIEKIRKEFVVNKDTATVKKALEEVNKKIANRTGVSYTVDTASLANVLVLPDPTLEDMKANGLMSFIVTKDLTASEAKDRIDSFLNRAGAGADSDLVRRAANRAAGNYKLTVNITNTSCNNSSVH